MKYDFQSIETKWQSVWEQAQTFKTPNPGEAGFDAAKPKFYVLDMFPYPSGVGLHVGHPLGYIATDILGRYKAMRGFNVLHPMGFDAFGLPAEQFAVEHGVHPRVTTEKNIANMVAQLKKLGLGYDWGRELATTDVDYYRWTQWIFLRLFDSWFDPSEKKAKPIATLVADLEKGRFEVSFDNTLAMPSSPQSAGAICGDNIGTRKWHTLSADERRAFIDAQRLAFLDEVEVNWCPRLGTVLANEEVTNEGRSERGNFPVFKRPLKQWMLRITCYAERLISDLDLVDWPESVKLLQRNWIGKSTGALVDFMTPEGDAIVTVFTTRPDTLFGATYAVLAPEHELVHDLTTFEQKDAVEAYIVQAAKKTAVERSADAKDKTGVWTGSYVVNPVNGQPIPVWVADYVMTGYGTGAIMAVPAHDARDHAFATKFGIAIKEVVKAPEGHDLSKKAYEDDGALVNSANDAISLNGLPVEEAKAKIIAWLDNKNLGRAKVQYKLRDWLFSRQRYWGEPFPILHGAEAANLGQIRAVPEDLLPVMHPHMEDFRPSGSDDPEAPPKPPLGRAPAEWREVELDGQKWTREFNSMPQWAGSCWYYLRYLDKSNQTRFVGADAEKYWMGASKENPAGGVDLYVGGVEHAVLHLLYARFWHKVLFDLGQVSTVEPFGKLFNQGYIQAYAYTDARGIYVEASEVVNADGQPAAQTQGKKGEKFFYTGADGVKVEVTESYGKMGKSLKNAVAPDEISAQYGADSLRLYEMYMGPLDQSKPWSTTDIVGVHRFLQRVWRNLINEETGAFLVFDDAPAAELERLTHKTIQRVTDAMDKMHFNVAIAALIELNNALVKEASIPRAVAEPLVRMLAPLAPHICEELWVKLGHEAGTVSRAPWPAFDPAKLVSDTVEIPVQINGKVKGRLTVAADANEAQVLEAAKADAALAPQLEGKTLRKVIFVPGRMLNLVVG